MMIRNNKKALRRTLRMNTFEVDFLFKIIIILLGSCNCFITVICNCSSLIFVRKEGKNTDTFKCS